MDANQINLLFIHQLNAQQSSVLRATLQDPRVYMWLRNGSPYTNKEINELIAYSRNDASEKWNKREYFYWGILSGARLVGMIGLHPALPDARRIFGRDCLQITYALNPNEQGKGYATRAIRALCAYDLRLLTSRCIIAIIRNDNFGSLKVMKHVADLFREHQQTIKKSNIEYRLFELVAIAER